MNLNLRWRVLITLGAIALAAVGLWPTLKYFNLDDEQRASMDPELVQQMKNDALRLGLDLQGGMHIVLEIDDSKADENVPTSELMDRALEVIRNRIDEFGVTEPVVQKAGEKRIIVELAGIDDIERAEEIIRRAAVLEFKMTRPGSEMRRVVDGLDRALARVAGVTSSDTTEDPAATDDTTDTEAEGDDDGSEEDTAAEVDPIDELLEDWDGQLPEYLATDARNAAGRPLSSRIQYRSRQGRVAINEIGSVLESDFERVNQYLKVAEAMGTIPNDVQFAWDSSTHTDPSSGVMRYLYLLNSQPELTGEVLEDARPQPDTQSNIQGNFLVEFDLSRRGSRLFSRSTGENVGRLMAIVLDGNVRSAPEIFQKIRGGTATITGSFTPEEASDLSIVLRAGALPVPIVIEEQRSVGPSLGQDSIELGTKAIMIGFGVVLVFMLIYYRFGGAIAVFALLLNLGFLAALLVYIEAVLTLPGIAGFVLTVGMAVDANVLIFERIREELRVGQSFRNAVNRGYDKAFRTILDANITTLITALALLWFGTGPIKGFAVVLSIGIVVSMFTALFVSRAVFDLMTSGSGSKNVPI